MQLHAALRDDPSLLGSLKRSFSRRGSLSVKKHRRERSGSTSPSPPSPGGDAPTSPTPASTPTKQSRQARPSLIALDMSQRIDWSSRTEAWLNEPATRPAQTTLLLELPELQSICLNHGERQFRIERAQGISVRDILIELDKFLHRPAPKLVGNFKTAKLLQREKSPPPQTLSVGVGSGDSGNGSDADELVDRPRSPKAVSLEVNVTMEGGDGGITPDASESSLSSQSSSAEKKPTESVLTRWLGDKTAFAGLKRAENHDFKLFVKMVKPDKDISHLH